MRVLLISSPLVEGTGGERRSYYIIEQFRKLGIEYNVVDLRAYLTKYVRGAISLHMINVIVNKLIKEKILSNSYDIVVSHHEIPSYILIAYMFSKILKTPFTSVLQLSWPLISGLSLSALKKYIPFGSCKFIATKIVLDILKKHPPLVVSEAIIEELKRNNIIVPKYFTLEVPIGIEHKYKFNEFICEEEYEGIFLARLEPAKGLFYIPYIWKFLVKEIPNAKLIVIGKVVNKKYIYRFFDIINRLNLKRNIIFKGPVDEFTKFKYLRCSRLMLYPSLKDAFPTVVLESLSMGTPVVSLNTAPLRSFKTIAVIREKNLKRMARKALNIIVSDNYYSMLRTSAIAYSKMFTWKNAALIELKGYNFVIKHF